MIEHMLLENWKSHHKTEIHFARGTNTLVGKMGSGKSSVLDALCFALYGTFPKISRRDHAISDIVSIFGGASFAKVAVTFIHKGERYEVERAIGGKISEAEIKKGGRLLQKGPKQVTGLIESILGADYDLFTRAIYSEQNNIDFLLSLKPRMRKQQIDWLLGLGAFDDAREAAQRAAGKLSETAAELGAEASQDKIAEVGKKIEGHMKQLEESMGKLASLRKNEGASLAKIRERGESLALLEGKRKEWQKLTQECERERGILERLRKEVEGKEMVVPEELARLQEKKAALAQKASEMKAKWKEIADEYSKMDSEFRLLENEKRLVEGREKRKKDLEKKSADELDGKNISELEKSLVGTRELIDELSSKKAKEAAEAEECLIASETILKGEGKCLVCDSPMPEEKAKAISAEKRALYEKKRQTAAEIGAEIRKAKETCLALEKKAALLREWQSEISRLVKEGADASTCQAKMEIAALGARKADEKRKLHEAELAAAEKSLDETRLRLEESVRVGKAFQDLALSEKKAGEFEEKIKKSDFKEEEYEKNRAALESLKVEHARVKAEAEGEEKQAKLIGELAKSDKEKLSGLEKKLCRARKYQDAAAGMTIYKNCLASSQAELRVRLLEEINEALSEIWPAIYPYSDYGGIRMEADDKDYHIRMEKEGWRDADSVASGGERACLCLALRIAFATVLTPDIGWLILDEPTHNLDSNAVSALSEAISKKIPEIVEQTIVITHDPALGETAEGNILKLERDKSKNEPTQVTKL